MVLHRNSLLVLPLVLLLIVVMVCMNQKLSLSRIYTVFGMAKQV